MELFTLGADRGYTERDVREQARALTGWRNDWSNSLGPVRFRYDKERHDPGVKTIFGKRGRFDWRDSGRLCVHHRLHPSFFVTKLWSYFVPVPPKAATKRALERLYVSSGYEVRPGGRGDPAPPRALRGPAHGQAARVYLAGLLRALRRGIDTEAWTWLLSLAGQQLFYPPNVAGWDDGRWLDTATYRARWMIAVVRDQAARAEERQGEAAERRRQAAAIGRRRSSASPTLTGHTHAALKRFATRSLSDAHARWKKEQYPALIENALRQLLATAPDLQTC